VKTVEKCEAKCEYADSEKNIYAAIEKLREDISSLNIEDLTDYFCENVVPKEYQLLAKSAAKTFLNMPWNGFVDFGSNVLKEYGRNEQEGGYKNTSQVLEGVKKKIETKLIKMLFEP
jgi:hypothetical protein